ncbi:ATP-binding protein [Kitasatospora cinereorecta]|uniref:ATP-binding protein n=1 Tax=Kitasatospora cinereorecta TaxID=285560 RepID=A0ABW0V9C3_9ACTN
MPETSTSSAVIGREGERERLGGLVQQVADGRGGVVVFTGEPGIGKTAVLDLAGQLCRDAGITVLRGAASELEERRPFSAVLACLTTGEPAARPDVARLRELLRTEQPTVPTAGGPGPGSVIAEALLVLLEDWCASTPVALLLDDLHWADAASLVVLHRLSRALEHLPLLVVLTSRPFGDGGAPGRALRSLAGRGVPVVEIQPLGGRDVARLVAAQVGGAPDEALLELVAGAAGNPYYVRGLVRALVEAGQIRVRESGAELVDDPPPVPASLRRTVLRRIDALSGATRELVRVLALLGPAFTAAEMTAVLQRSAFELMEPVSEAIAAGLLREHPDGLAFRHDLVRRVLEESHAPAIRAALHQQIGRSLADSHVPPDRVAEHLLKAPDVGGPDLPWLRSALDRLIARAPGLAVDLLRRVVGPETPDLEAELVGALVCAGRFTEAEQAAGRLLSGGLPAPWQGTTQWWLAQVLLRQGRLSECTDLCSAALRDTALTESQSARFHGLLAHCRHLLADHATAEQEAARAVGIGRDVGDADATAHGLCVQAAVQLVGRRAEGALALADEALAVLGDRRTGFDIPTTPQLVRGHCLLVLDRLADAYDAFRTGVEFDPEGRFHARYRCALGKVGFLSGEWEAALAEVRTGLASADVRQIEPELHAVAALVQVQRGRRCEHTRFVRDLAAGSREPIAVGGVHRWGYALLCESEGEPEQALRLLVESCRPGPEQSGGSALADFMVPDTARLAFTLGRTDRLIALAATAHEAAATLPTPTLRATAELCSGLAEHEPGRLVEAAALYRTASRPLFAALAHEVAALMLARSARRREAREELTRAVEAYRVLGAEWPARRVAEGLMAEGVRAPRGRSTERTATGWDSLTETEHTVIAMVAEGCSNPEIADRMRLARRTVQTHISRILAKLDKSSRVELAVLAAERADR